VVESCPGIDIEVLTDLPYRRGITSLFDKCFDEVEDLSLPGCQFHSSLFTSNCGFRDYRDSSISKFLKVINPKHEIRNSKQAQMFKI
jgi:hypothetical protein